MRNRVFPRLAGGAILLIAVATFAWPAGAAGTEVSVGSNDALFSQNKQNEPALAVDAAHPDILVAGANDNIDVSVHGRRRDDRGLLLVRRRHDLEPADLYGIQRTHLRGNSRRVG